MNRRSFLCRSTCLAVAAPFAPVLVAEAIAALKPRSTDIRWPVDLYFGGGVAAGAGDQLDAVHYVREAWVHHDRARDAELRANMIRFAADHPEIRDTITYRSSA